MTIRDFLRQYQGQKVYYKPNPGNGGDALIAYAAYSLFNELKIDYTVIREGVGLENKVVFYGGGGNLVEEYDHASTFITDVLDSAQQLVILPHTINGHKELIQRFDKRVTVFCREERSFQYVKRLNDACNTHLLEDLAFALPVADILNKGLSRKVLSIMFRKSVFRMFRYQKQVLAPCFSLLFGKRLNAYRIDAEKTSVKKPTNNMDLSVLILYDKDMLDERLVEKNVVDLFKVLNKYSVINTNRLHICIAGTLLGKTVNFYPNSYYKNEGIYLMSLKDKFVNVRWKGTNNSGMEL